MRKDDLVVFSDDGITEWATIKSVSNDRTQVRIVSQFDEMHTVSVDAIVTTTPMVVKQSLFDFNKAEAQMMAACMSVPQVGTPVNVINDRTKFFDHRECPEDKVPVMIKQTDLGYEDDGDPFHTYITVYLPREILE